MYNNKRNYQSGQVISMTCGGLLLLLIMICLLGACCMALGTGGTGSGAGSQLLLAVV